MDLGVEAGSPFVSIDLFAGYFVDQDGDDPNFIANRLEGANLMFDEGRIFGIITAVEPFVMIVMVMDVNGGTVTDMTCPIF